MTENIKPRHKMKINISPDLDDWILATPAARFASARPIKKIPLKMDADLLFPWAKRPAASKQTKPAKPQAKP